MDPLTGAFFAVAALLIVTPGADFAIVVRNALHGRRQGLATSAGTIAGLLVHTTAAVLGISSLLAASATAFTVVKVLGGLYLVWLGMRALLGARRHRAQRAGSGSGPGACLTPRQAFRQGLLTNVLNPKATLIFISVLPQFIPADAQVVPRTVLLSLILVTMAALWYAAVAALVHQLRGVLSRASVRRALDRVTGTVLVALGLRLLVTKRPVPA